MSISLRSMARRLLCLSSVVPSLFLLFLGAVRAEDGGSAAGDPTQAKTHHVPADFPTIQCAIDAAGDGDTVLVAPGTYEEGLEIKGKSIILASHFVRSNDPADVLRTVLEGAIPEDEFNEGRREQVLLIHADAGPRTEIVGFTIRGGDDGVSCEAQVSIRHNRFLNNVDALDYEGGGGLCEHNYFERNEDDAIDLDGDCAATVQHNRIVNNLDDGIEIRLEPYRGKQLEILIRDNVIAGNAEDGIQIIDYPGVSDRRIRIKRNLIARNSMAAIGFMSDAETREDHRAASIPERIEVVGNTLADNQYGITGGENLLVKRNMFLQHPIASIKSGGGADISGNLFWANRADETLSTQ